MWNKTDGSGTYRYYLNICNMDEDDGLRCPEEEDSRNVSACQRKESETKFAEIIGKMDKQTLRYVLFLSNLINYDWATFQTSVHSKMKLSQFFL